MDICLDNDHYFNPLLDNLSKEAKKTIYLLGDFNNDLLNSDISEHVRTFLDDLLIIFLIIYKAHLPKVQFLETSHQVYQIIFHNSLYYQNFFQSPLQLNITLYPMTGKSLIISHFFKILKK